MIDKNRNKSWRVGEDGKGRTMLVWDTDPQRAEDKPGDDRDPLAQTYNFLQALDVPELAIENEEDDDGSRNPYDSKV